MLNSRAPPEFASSWSVVSPVDCVAAAAVDSPAPEVVEPAAVDVVEVPPPQPAARIVNDTNGTTRIECGRVIDPRRIPAS